MSQERLIRYSENLRYLQGTNMSSTFGLNKSAAFQQVITIALMLISFLAVFYSDIELGYKIGIAVLAFTIIFLANIATQILKGIPKRV